MDSLIFMVFKSFNQIVYNNFSLITPMKDFIKFIFIEFLNKKRKSLIMKDSQINTVKLISLIISESLNLLITMDWVFSIFLMNGALLPLPMNHLLSLNSGLTIKSMRIFHNLISIFHQLSSKSNILQNKLITLL